MVTNYQRGANFERKIKKQYEKKGYYVTRSAGSRQPADLVALKIFKQHKLIAQNPQVILIQCGNITKQKKEKLIKLAMLVNAKARFYQIPPKRKVQTNFQRKQIRKEHQLFKRRKAGLNVKEKSN